MISLNPLASSVYQIRRRSIIKVVEQIFPLPYVDSVGLPTIGIGFLLKDLTQGPAVLSALGFRHLDQTVSGEIRAREQYYVNRINALVDQEFPKGFDAVLRTALDSIMVERADDGQLASLGALPRFFGFDSATDPRIDQVLSNVIGVYEERVNKWLPGIDESRERLALVSLAYNGLINVGASPRLREAVVSGNRAEGWYEIRYESNRGKSQSGGIAKRRYYESQLFGLYDNPDAVGAVEARETYRTLTRHRKEILDYEKSFGADPNGSTPDAPAKHIAAANSDYGLSGSTDQVQTLTQAFNAAKDALLLELSYLYPQLLSISVDRSTDIYVADDTKNWSLDATTDRTPSGAERVAKNILIGGSRNDDLTGGKGDDLLIGGEGLDTYYFRPGDGSDVIVDSDRRGRIIIRGSENRAAGGVLFSEDGVPNTWTSPDGSITITHNSPFKITLPDGTQVELGEILNDGDFGIHLRTRPADVPTTRTILGDRVPEDVDLVTPGLQTGPDDLGNLRITGTPEPDRADVLFDSAGSDLIQSGGGDDVINATRGGSDTIEAGAGRDTVHAGDGDDLVEAGPGTDIVSGGGGKDRLYADTRIDMAAAVAAGSGAGSGQKGDWLIGGADDDIVIGGAGNDALFGGEGEDLLIGGAGNDLLNGDDDHLATSFDWNLFLAAAPSFDSFWQPVSVLTPAPYAGGADTIYAGAGDDYVVGLDGDDVIYGEAGADILSGGDNDDVVIGGADNDRITGDFGAFAYSSGQIVAQGNDFLDGGGGDDWLQGEAGADLLFGGEGSDQLYGDAEYLSVAQHGADYLEGEAGVDFLFGQGGEDSLFGGADGDFLWGDAGADLLDGGAGADYLEGGSEADTLYGGTEIDTLFGNAGADILDGGEGDDLLNAGDDADTLIGGPGADTLIGGAGDDTYQAYLAEGDRIVDDEGGNLIAIGDALDLTAIVASSTVVDGQPGILLKSDSLATTGLFMQGGLVLLEASNPTYQFVDGNAFRHSILMETVFTEDLTLAGTAVGDALKGYAGADLIQGLAGADWLSGGAADDVIEGGDGDDELIGGAGADTLRGGLGNDTYTVDAEDTIEELPDEGTDTVLADLSYTLGANLENLTLTGEAAIDATGNTLDNTLTGNDAENLLQGLAGADALSGGGGADTLEGGVGDDLLAGGAGDDEYLLSAGDGADTIEDASGLNAIRFGTGIDASSLTIDQFVGDDGASYLRIGYGTGGDAVAIRDGLLGGIGEYRFADGTVRTHEGILASLGALAVQGTGANDTIVGGASADVLDGAAGADQLFGRGADDLLRGGEGDDVLWGEAGNDVLDGGPGADTLTGGTGEDTYLVSWGMGEDTIVEDPGGLNRLRLGTAVAFADLVADRIDDDLVLSLRGGSNRLTLAGYYGAAQDWLVTDSASETRTFAEVIAQSPSGPPDPVEAAIVDYKSNVQRAFYRTRSGVAERTVSIVTSGGTSTTHSTYLVQELVQPSDAGFITRATPAAELTMATTVTAWTMTVYETLPGGRAVGGGLAAHGAANGVGWRYLPRVRLGCARGPGFADARARRRQAQARRGDAGGGRDSPGRAIGDRVSVVTPTEDGE